MRRSLALLVAVLVLGACDRGQSQAAGGQATGEEQPALTGEWRIIPLRHGAMMFLQGSRDVPAPATAFFTPTAQQIAQMEAALITRLERDGYFAAQATLVRDTFAAEGLIAEAKRGEMAVTLASGWVREYIGIERSGIRSIYGNYSLKRAPLPASHAYDRTMPTLVDDGGPTFFGAEYALEAGIITHLSFNGGP